MLYKWTVTFNSTQWLVSQWLSGTLTGSWSFKKFWLFSQFMIICESRSVISNSLWPTDCSLPVSSVLGILQARILEWVAILFSRGSSQPRDRTRVSCIASGFFTNCATREAPIWQEVFSIHSSFPSFTTNWASDRQLTLQLTGSSGRGPMDWGSAFKA